MYYLLRYSNETYINSSESQTNINSEQYNVREDYSLWNINYHEKVNFDLRIPEFFLHPKARLTDLIFSNHYSPFASLMISEFFWNILQTFKLPAYQEYPTTLRDSKENVYPYYFIYFYESDDTYLNFPKSAFYVKIRGENGFKIKEQKVKSLEDYFKLQRLFKEENIKLEVLESVLKEDIPLNLFRTKKVVLPLFISEALRNALSENEITGIKMPTLEENYGQRASRIRTTMVLLGLKG